MGVIPGRYYPSFFLPFPVSPLREQHPRGEPCSCVHFFPMCSPCRMDPAGGPLLDPEGPLRPAISLSGRDTHWILQNKKNNRASGSYRKHNKNSTVKRSECKRLSDPAGNIIQYRYVFGQGSCHQQGHTTISKRAPHRAQVQDQSGPVKTTDRSGIIPAFKSRWLPVLP